MLNKKLLGGSSGLPQDDNFENVTLLLNGDGTNGGQNNTFVDSSTNNFTITRNGNTTQGSFSPYGSLWSAYLGANGNYFTSGTNSALGFGTGDFTIEFFLFVNNWVDNQFLIDFRPSGNAGAQRIYFYLTTSGSLIYGFSGSNKITSANSVVSLGTWTHIAITRASGSTKVFVNGSQVGSTYSGSEDLGSNERFVVGTFGDAPGSSNANGGTITGYISNLRILKGTAQYTGSYTVPIAPLTAITNTSVLTFQSNRYVDNSANAISITPSGTPSVQRFSPFEPSDPYSTSVIGGSGYFDGSGDYLVAGTSSNLALGSGNFTVDGWYYLIAAGGGAAIYSGINTYPSSTGLILYVDSGNVIRVDCNGTILSAGSSPVNQWVYFSLVRSGSTITLYINSSSAGTATLSTNLTDQYVVLGRTGAGTSSNSFNGYLANIRVTPGTAIVPTSNPTSLNSSVSGTQFLANFTNASIFDYAMMNNLETAGNAQVSTSVKKFGTGSIYFDGNGDLLQFPRSPNLSMGSGNFTYEFWLYVNAANGSIFDTRTTNNVTTGFTLLLNSTPRLAIYTNTTNLTCNTTLATSTWYHVAVVRNGSTLTVYLNGTSDGSLTFTNNLSDDSLRIGQYIDGTGSLNAYIDDFRITKGVARYTANFTPPTTLPTY